MSAASLFVGVPCFGGQITQQCAAGLAELVAEARARGIACKLQTLGHLPIVELARNEIVSQFLDTDATHLLFVDADTEFRAADALGMLAAGKGLVCGACPKKRYDWTRIREAARAGHADLAAHGTDFTLEFDYTRGAPTTNADGSVTVMFDAPDGCVPIVHAGTGFLMIERRVLLAVIEHERSKARRAQTALERLVACASLGKRREAGELADLVRAQLRQGISYDLPGPARPGTRHAVFECEVQDGRFVGEDVVFVRRAREAGEPLWLYVPAHLGHVAGPIVFRKPLSMPFAIQFPSVEKYRRACEAIAQGRAGDWA